MKYIRKTSRYFPLFILFVLAPASFLATGVTAQEPQTTALEQEKRAERARLLAPAATFPTSAALPVSIPENNATFTCIDFPVSGLTANVGEVSLELGLLHPWVGDLRAELRAPGGAPVHTMFYDIGDANSPGGNGSGSNLSGVYNFVDSAATTLWTGADGGGNSYNIPAGNYRTTNVNTNTATSLNATFLNLTPAQANGTWQFCISDNQGQGSNTGSINTSANLTITPLAPTGVSVELEGFLLTDSGNAVRRATVILSDLYGNQRTATVNRWGHYRFTDVDPGYTYTLTAFAKGYVFSPPTLLITPTTGLTGLNFKAALPK